MNSILTSLRKKDLKLTKKERNRMKVLGQSFLQQKYIFKCILKYCFNLSLICYMMSSRLGTGLVYFVFMWIILALGVSSSKTFSVAIHALDNHLIFFHSVIRFGLVWFGFIRTARHALVFIMINFSYKK